MAKLIEVATRIQDMYEQNYLPNDRFLDIGDFKYAVATTYSTMLDALFQVQRKSNNRETGFANIENPASWLIDDPQEVQYDEKKNKYYSLTKHPVYTYNYDNHVYSLQDVIQDGCPDCRYRQISLNERSFTHLTPPAGVVFFYMNTASEIIYIGAKKGAQVQLKYIPVIVGAQDDCLLSDNIVGPVSDKVLATYFQAKNGNFIQKLDNQNPNVVPQQQVDQTVK